MTRPRTRVALAMRPGLRLARGRGAPRSPGPRRRAGLRHALPADLARPHRLDRLRQPGERGPGGDGPPPRSRWRCSTTSAPTSGSSRCSVRTWPGLHDGHVYAFEAAPENAEAIRRQRRAQRDRQHHGDRQGGVLARRPRPAAGRRRSELVKARGIRRAPEHRAGDRRRARGHRRPASRAGELPPADRGQDRRRGGRDRRARGHARRRSSATGRRSSASCTTPTPSSSR